MSPDSPAQRIRVRSFLLTLGLFLCACRGTSHEPSSAPTGEGAAPLAQRPPPEPAASAPVDDGFRLDFSLTEGETSKDSHQIIYSCRVTGMRAVYSGPYGECERGQCEHKETSFDLDAGQRVKLIALVREGGLLSEFQEAHPDRTIGRWIEASLTVTAAEGSGRTAIGGMTDAWGKTEPGALVISSDAQARVSALDAVKRYLAEIASIHYPEYLKN